MRLFRKSSLFALRKLRAERYTVLTHNRQGGVRPCTDSPTTTSAPPPIHDPAKAEGGVAHWWGGEREREDSAENGDPEGGRGVQLDGGEAAQPDPRLDEVAAGAGAGDWREAPWQGHCRRRRPWP